MSQYTEAQKKQLLELIEKWKIKLRLPHWRINVIWDEPAELGSVLDIDPQPNIHYASIRVGAFFDDDVSDQKRENAVAHELIHCHAEPLWETVNGLLGELGSQARAHMYQVVRQQFEQMIDALATSFAPID